jgi:hypothetical protein
MQLQAREFKWGLSEVKWSGVEWSDGICVRWFCFEVKWVTVNLGTKVPCTLGWLFYHFSQYFSGFILYICVYICIFGCIFCMLLFNFVNYFFLSLYILIVMYLYCLCVNVYCTAATGCQTNVHCNFIRTSLSADVLHVPVAEYIHCYLLMMGH